MLRIFGWRFKNLWTTICVVFMVISTSSEAYATCWEKADGSGYCCSAPQSPSQCHTYSKKERARKKTADKRHASAKELKELRLRLKETPITWEQGFAFEIGGGLNLGVQTDDARDNGLTPTYFGFLGTTLSASASGHSAFNHSRLVKTKDYIDVLVGMMTMGITLIPVSGWVGNDHGLRVKGNISMANVEDPLHGRLLFEPLARIVSEDDRWRASSIVEVFLPGVGIEWHHGDSNLILSVPSIAAAWLLSKHVAVEVEASVVHRQLVSGWVISPQLNIQLLRVN